MAEAYTQSTDEERRGLRGTAPFILTGLSGGHGVFHWFSQSFFVMLPEVVATFGLSGLQVGAIATTREVVSGLIALPGGVVTDIVRRQWGLVLAGCMALFGLGWLVMGIAPVYPVLLIGMAAVAAAASMWHLPSAAALSQRFADRRGSALSIHGVGGNVGDVLGPALTGVLLLSLSWKGILSIYAVIPLLLAFVVFWGFRDIGRTGSQDIRPNGFGEQMTNTRLSFKEHPRLWGIMAVAGLRGMANVAFLPFLALYLGLDTAMTHFEDGLAFCREAGYRPELAWTCCDYADMLIQRSVKGDHAKAMSLLDESLTIASELGMRPLMERVKGLQENAEARQVREPVYPDGLTQREVEVLQHICGGKTDREIAEELFISINTASKHVSNILNKINAANRAEAASYANQHGLVTLISDGEG